LAQYLEFNIGKHKVSTQYWSAN